MIPVILHMIIKKKNSSPKYFQLKNQLKDYFNKEKFKSGQVIPTEEEIKDAYQVGRNTVRRALEELVIDGIIIKKHGSGSYYSGTVKSEPNFSALIGVIVPKLTFYIYPQIIQGINQVVNKKGFNIVFGSSEVNLDLELKSLKQLFDKNIEGLLIEPSGGSENFENSSNFKSIKNLDIPVVFMDWSIEDKDVSFVCPNDFIGGYRVTQYLINAGHQRIAYIGPYDKGAGIKRMNGYYKALKKAGIQKNEVLVKLTSITNWNDKNNIPQMVTELLNMGNDCPTAIFFFNDDGAIKGLRTIRQLGLTVPDDISIVGYDNSELATLTDVSLTSAIHPKEKLGILAAELLFEKLEDPKNAIASQILINPGLAERESVKQLVSKK